MNNNNLDTFRILFLVKGILTLIGSLLFIFYACFGFFFQNTMEQIPDNDAEVVSNFGFIFVIIGGIGFLLTLTLGILTIKASKDIKAQNNYTFIFAMAIINCFTGILGILLGIFTIIELNKPEVKALFDKE